MLKYINDCEIEMLNYIFYRLGWLVLALRGWDEDDRPTYCQGCRYCYGGMRGAGWGYFKYVFTI